MIASCLQNTDARGILSAIDRDEKYQIDNNKIYSVVLVQTYSKSKLLFTTSTYNIFHGIMLTSNGKQSYWSIWKLYYMINGMIGMISLQIQRDYRNSGCRCSFCCNRFQQVSWGPFTFKVTLRRSSSSISISVLMAACLHTVGRSQSEVYCNIESGW